MEIGYAGSGGMATAKPVRESELDNLGKRLMNCVEQVRVVQHRAGAIGERVLGPQGPKVAGEERVATGGSGALGKLGAAIDTLQVEIGRAHDAVDRLEQL